MRLFRINLMTLAGTAFLVHSLFAQEWPQWRGPHRDGHVEQFSVPAKWPDSLKLPANTTSSPNSRRKA